MREERRQLTGDQVIPEPVELWGKIIGNVSVVMGGKLYVRGAIYGNLVVHNGGRVHVFGHITGSLTVKHGAKVIHSGIVGGDAINSGGRLFIESGARVLGKLKDKSGETTIEPGAQVQQ